MKKNEIDYNKLFFDEELEATINGKHWIFTIELQDFHGNPDCKIGDFGNNFWFRTAKATRKVNGKYERYKTKASLKRAVIAKLFKVFSGYEIEKYQWIKESENERNH